MAKKARASVSKKAPAKKAPAKKAPAKKAPAKPVSTAPATKAASKPTPPRAQPKIADPEAQRVVELLRAGGFMPFSATPPAPADPVSARAYSHPALGARVVVRLTSTPIAEGEDRVLEFLGFQRPEVTDRVALCARRSLGFPAWALVNDPKNARHALDVVGEMRRGIRQARTKPGSAKDIFDEIAKKLGRAVPHFLPSYYEQVARHFAAAGSRAAAASAFARAREAERVHALPVDREALDAAFLEFALSGALTTKALSEHAQELTRASDPAGAYASFRELCLRRTLGGVPPWAGMSKDLRRLARAAGHDAAAEDEALVEELLGAPAVARAPAEFWSEYRDAIVSVAKRAPAAATNALLALTPHPSSTPTDFHDRWLALLEDTGAIDALMIGAGDVKAASWLTRMVSMTAGTWRREGPAPDRLLVIARRLAPRLIADGQEVDLAPAGSWRIDVDLCDLLLELAVPVAAPRERVQVKLESWVTPPAGSRERPRDPIHLSQDSRFAPLLQDAVVRLLPNEAFHVAAQGKKAFAAAIRAALSRMLDAFEREGLLGVRVALATLQAASRRAFATCPDLHARLRGVDVASALARTLQTGVFDELGWSEFDAAMKELDPRDDTPPTLGGAFPYLVIASSQRAIVLGPKGRILEHDLRPPKNAQGVALLRYAGGQLLVAHRVKGTYAPVAYWTGDPAKTFELDQAYYRHEIGVCVELPDGGITEGGRALHAGEARAPERFHVVSDGTTYWRCDWGSGKWRLRELDPRTGDLGRASLPRFFEDFSASGKTLVLSGETRLMPLPAGLERTPLGTRGGLIGLRIRTGGGVTEYEGVDGRRFAGSLPTERGHAVSALLAVPGDEARPRPVAGSRGPTTIHAPDGSFVVASLPPKSGPYARGTAWVLPVDFWHFLTPRDEVGSRTLRVLTVDTARGLLSTALAARRTDDEDAAALSALEALVRERLPAVTNPALVRGVAGILDEAVALTRLLAKVVDQQDPTAAPDRLPAVSLKDPELRTALNDLVPVDYRYGDLSRELEEVGALLTRSDALGKPRAVGPSGLRWTDLVGRIGAVAFRAVAIGTAEDSRPILRALLAVWARTPFASAPHEYRRATFAFAEGKTPFPAEQRENTWIVEADPGRVVLRTDSRSHYMRDDEGKFIGLQRGRDGRFGVPAGATVSDEQRCDAGWGTPAQIERFLTIAEERGPLPDDPQIAETLSRRTGLPLAEATLLWAGLPLFVDKPRAAKLGLKLNAGAAVARTLQRIPADRRLRALAGALGEDPSDLWSPLGTGPDDDASAVARLARAWIEAVGRRAAVPEDLVVAVAKDLRGHDGTEMLTMFADPAAAPRLQRDGSSSLVERQWNDREPDVFDDRVLTSVAVGIPYLFLTRPVGDPLRTNIPEVLRLARERLKNPALVLPAGTIHVDATDAEDAKKKRQAIIDGIGGEPIEWRRRPSDETAVGGRDNGAVVALDHGWSVRLCVRPGRLRTPAELATIHALTEGTARLTHLQLLLSDDHSRFAARTQKTPVPEGGWEGNPLLACAPLVREVSKEIGVDEDAAALYLQTLAHPTPTSKLVQTMNGWSTARYKKAGEALVKKGLLVEAKRERAGRTWFLPGGWETLRAPALPIESWKQSFYEFSGHTVLLPLQPMHEVFAKAWARVRGGDGPKYEKPTGR